MRISSFAEIALPQINKVPWPIPNKLKRDNEKYSGKIGRFIQMEE